jgi:hypothetical protein
MRLHNHFIFFGPETTLAECCQHNFLKMRVKENVALLAARGLLARWEWKRMVTPCLY